MRHTVRAFVFVLSVVVLSSSLPAAAAEQVRDRGMRERETPIVVVVKRLIKRFFGITSNEEMTPPHPAPTSTP